MSSLLNETEGSDIEVVDGRSLGRRGCAARWRKELHLFERLWILRGAFREGTRANAVMIYTYLLKRNRRTDEEIIPAAVHLSRQCSPPLPDGEIGHRIDCGLRRLTCNLTRATIHEWLRVTAEERLHLDPDESLRLQRAAKRDARDQAMVAVLSQHEDWPARRVARYLRGAGHDVSDATVWRRRNRLNGDPEAGLTGICRSQIQVQDTQREREGAPQWP